MRPALFVRPLTADEGRALEAGLRSSDAFVVRRSQCLLKSAAGLTPRQIQAQLGWSDQSVRRFIRAFAKEGLGCLQEKSHRPKSAQKTLAGPALAQLGEWLRQSPRDFGLPTSCFGETRHYVTSVRLQEEISLSPGVIVPVRPASAASR